MDKLTKNQLKERLEILRQILLEYEKDKFYNISFINIDAFYSHLEIYNKTDFSVKHIMDSIDKYIPLKRLADMELIDIFESGICCENLDELNYFKTIFYKKAVLKFLDLIKKAKTNEEWIEILKACENIRKMG